MSIDDAPNCLMILLPLANLSSVDAKASSSCARLYAGRAREEGQLGAKTGSVTVLQRVSSDLRLNPHVHAVFLDGAWHEQEDELCWQGLAHLKTSEVGAVLESTLRRIERHGTGERACQCAIRVGERRVIGGRPDVDRTDGICRGYTLDSLGDETELPGAISMTSTFTRSVL